MWVGEGRYFGDNTRIVRYLYKSADFILSDIRFGILRRIEGYNKIKSVILISVNLANPKKDDKYLLN